MWRRFCWGGSTSVSTASALEITLKSKILYRLLVMSVSPAAVPDDTEVVPPKSRRAKAIAKKLSSSAPLREITVPAKPPPTQDCPENPGVKPVATKKRFIVIYRENTNLCLMWRRFCWGGSTSVSTASALEITLKSKILYRLLVMSVSPAAVPDDTEVVPPKCPDANAAAVPDDTEVVPPKVSPSKSSPYSAWFDCFILCE